MNTFILTITHEILLSQSSKATHLIGNFMESVYYKGRNDVFTSIKENIWSGGAHLAHGI